MTDVVIIAGLVLVAIIWVFVGIILPVRRRRWALLAEEDKARVDEALGTWAHGSMIARDRKRGYGHHAQSRGVRE